MVKNVKILQSFLIKLSLRASFYLCQNQLALHLLLVPLHEEGQEVDVKLIGFDRGKMKLSMKALSKKTEES